MKQDGNDPWYTSIPAIVVFLIFFWPVGIIFLCLRLSKNKGKYATVNISLLLGTIILLFFGFAGMTTFFDTHDMSDFFLATFMFILPGCICGYCWYKRKLKFKEYKVYLDYINVRKRAKLGTLSNKLNVSYDTAVNTLTEIINKGLINGYLTDTELIINGENDAFYNINDTQEEEKQTKVIKCKECGAKNTIVIGETKECEYCGSLLQ